MCIAIYSPKGTKVPCEEYLRTSFIHNDDGAGFAFNTDNRDVQIVKGLMKWEDFITTFRRYDKEYNFQNRGVLIHFRITTHGGTNKECCHPFPLTSDVATMRKPAVHAPYAVIHNGIISLTSTDAWLMDKCSDTMLFISKYMSKIATNPGWFKNKTNWELIYDLADSKVAALDGKGNIMSTAGFTQDADGNWYSNSSYKEARAPKTVAPYRGGWSDYDGYDGYGYGYHGYNNYGYSGYKDYRSTKTDLMRLRPDEYVMTDEGDEIFGDDTSNVYVTSDNAIFVQDKSYEYEGVDGAFVREPAYFGEAYAVFTMAKMDVVPFRKDAYAWLSPSDYFWYDEDEEESGSDFDAAKDKEEAKLTVYAKQNK